MKGVLAQQHFYLQWLFFAVIAFDLAVKRAQTDGARASFIHMFVRGTQFDQLRCPAAARLLLHAAQSTLNSRRMHSESPVVADCQYAHYLSLRQVLCLHFVLNAVFFDSIEHRHRYLRFLASKTIQLLLQIVMSCKLQLFLTHYYFDARKKTRHSTEK